MTKQDVALLVAKRLNIKIRDVERILDTTFDTIAELVANNEVVDIHNFCRFKTKHTKDRIGNNPRTQEKIPLKGNTLPIAICFPNFKKRVKEANEKFDL
ncbi:MAG: HU family DNA-binding protein [bacterium]